MAAEGKGRTPTTRSASSSLQVLPAAHAAWMSPAAPSHGAIAGDGIDRLSVERLATSLGVTKGSFYWHFADRAALIVAAAEHWEQVATEDVITTMADVEDPEQRLRGLFEVSFGDDELGPTDTALVARAEDPVIGEIVRRATGKRIAFLESVFADLGFSRSTARASGAIRLRRLSRPLPDGERSRAGRRRSGCRTFGLPRPDRRHDGPIATADADHELSQPSPGRHCFPVTAPPRGFGARRSMRSCHAARLRSTA